MGRPWGAFGTGQGNVADSFGLGSYCRPGTNARRSDSAGCVVLCSLSGLEAEECGRSCTGGTLGLGCIGGFMILGSLCDSETEGPGLDFGARTNGSVGDVGTVVDVVEE